MGFYEQLGAFFENAARTFLYLLLMIPLLLLEIMGEAVDVISGAKDTPHGAPLYFAAEAGAPPLCEYDEYICFDIDMMDKRRGQMNAFENLGRGREFEEYINYNVYYYSRNYIVDPNGWFVYTTEPFHGYYSSYARGLQSRWERAPRSFKSAAAKPTRMSSYIEIYYNLLYTGDPYNTAIYTLDDKVVRPVSYEFEEEIYWYVPGDEVGRTGRFRTPLEATEDYTRRFLNIRANYVDIYPFTHWYPDYGVEPSSGGYNRLGPAITFLTKEQTARRSWVRYEKKLGDGYFSYYGNRMNDDMYDAGYADFRYYDGVEFWVNAKYWTEESGIGHSDHCFSLQFYYSVKPMWRAYIDNHPEYVADVKKGRNDPARYTENFLEWMKAHNITPGTEQMYEELSKFINQGRDLGAISEDGESGGNIMNMFFTSSIMRYLFWGMTLISLALCMACSIVAVINSMGDSQVKRPVGQVIGTIGKTMFTFLIVPVLIMVAINLSGIILRQVNQVFDMGTTGSSQQPTSMATAIIAASLTEDSVRNVPAGEIRALELEKQKRNLLSGRITWKEPIQFIGIFDPFQMYLIPSIITAWFCLMIMIMVLMMFSRRVYELLLLYIASPFTICSMPLDGGAKFKAWREAFISKVLSGFSSVFTIKVVILMMPLIWTSGITLIDYNETYDTVLKLMIMAGGMYAAYKSHTLINNLLMLGGGGDTDKETSTFAAQNTFVKAGSAAMRTAKKIDKGVTDFAFKAAEKTVTYKSDQRKDAKDKAKKKDEESKKEKMFSDLLPVKGGTTANNKSEKELRKQSKTLDSMKKKYKKLKKLEKLKNQENMPLTDKEKKRLAKKSGKNHKYRVKKLYKDNMDNKSSQGNKDLYLK